MGTIDWGILIGTLLFIVGYGTYKSRGNKNVTDYIKGGNEAKWWTIGLSVMATQASAITFLSTPGQAFHDGMAGIRNLSPKDARPVTPKLCAHQRDDIL